MKIFRILAVVIFVCALVGLGLQVIASVVYHQPVTVGLALDIGAIFIAGFWWFFGRGHEKRLKQYAEASARKATGGMEPSVAPRDYAGLLAAMERRLDSAGYSVVRDVALPNDGTADLVASRVEFTLDINTPIVQHLFLRHLAVATTEDFDVLFEAGYRHAQAAYRGSLLRGKHFGHVVLPCIAIDTATPGIVAAASGRPPKRWMRFEFPVAYDLSTGRTYYYGAKTPALGSMLFPGARALANLAFDIGHPSAAS